MSRARLAYRLLLGLLPPSFRRAYREELEGVLARRLEAAPGRRARLMVWAVTLADLALAVPREWGRELGRTPGADASPDASHRTDAMDTLRQDVRYAFRSLAKSPGFTAIAVLTLALGIGANTAIFSVVDAVLLRPLPYAEPGELVRIQGGWEGTFGDWLSEPEIRDIREGVDAVESVGSWDDVSANLTGEGEPERLETVAAMPELFRVLGVGTLHGRAFTAEEGAPGGAAVALLSEGLFRRRFGSDPSIVGSSIRINGNPRTVVGVLPPEFRLPDDFQGPATELYLPLVLNPDSLASRGSHYLHTVARLAPGASVEGADTQLRALAARLTAEGFYPAENPFSMRPVSLREDVFGEVRPALMVLLGAVGFVLLVACANVANLLLARGEERQREMAVRVAMGADRLRIVRQLLTESLILAGAGAAVGIGLAALGTRLLVALDPARIPRVDAVGMDGPVLLVTLATAALTGLLFGAAPAVQALRGRPGEGLRDGGRGSSAGRRRIGARRILAVSELALTVVLVIGAGLMVRTFAALRSIEPGFEPAGVLSMRLSLPEASYPEDADVTAFYGRLVDEVEALPSVRSAGVIRVLPLSATLGDWSIDIEGYDEQPGENPHGDWQVASPGYFETMGIRLLEGRFPGPSDDERQPPSVVINRTMADEYWPDGALGRRFRTSGEWATIVGVVEDLRHNALVEEPRTEMYHVHAQYPRVAGYVPRTMSLVVRGEGGAAALAAPVREVVRALDPDLPVSRVATMDEVLADAVAEQRFTVVLLAVFGAVALLLAVVGIYGVLSYSVSRRMHEMGIRRALGAERSGVVRLVVADGMRLAVLGLTLGVILAFGLTRLMASLLYQVEAVDPLTFVAVPALLGGAALLATWVPALRASGVPPTEALRAE